jgi:hypothetical protein
VTVDMVHVGHVRMNVLNWAMLVPMGVRFALRGWGGRTRTQISGREPCI